MFRIVTLLILIFTVSSLQAQVPNVDFGPKASTFGSEPGEGTLEKKTVAEPRQMYSSIRVVMPSQALHKRIDPRPKVMVKVVTYTRHSLQMVADCPDNYVVDDSPIGDLRSDASLSYVKAFVSHLPCRRQSEDEIQAQDARDREKPDDPKGHPDQFLINPDRAHPQFLIQWDKGGSNQYFGVGRGPTHPKVPHPTHFWFKTDPYHQALYGCCPNPYHVSFGMKPSEDRCVLPEPEAKAKGVVILGALDK